MTVNQKEYMQVLSNYLKKLPAPEREDVLLFYQEFFEEAGIEREQEVIKNLGDPKKLASQIIAQSQMKEISKMPNTAKKGFSSIGVVILTIFASPVALPIVIVVLVALLCILVSIFAVIISLFGSAIGIAVCGLAMVILSFTILPFQISSFVVVLGIGLVCIGLGVLLFLGTLFCAKGIVKLTTILAGKMVERKKQI